MEGVGPPTPGRAGPRAVQKIREQAEFVMPPTPETRRISGGRRASDAWAREAARRPEMQKQRPVMQLAVQIVGKACYSFYPGQEG